MVISYNTYKADYEKRKNKNILFFKKYLLPYLIIIATGFFIQLIFHYTTIYTIKTMSNNMEPSIPGGKTIFMIYPQLTQIRHNDIVSVFSASLNQEFLCRVVATEGEKVAFIGRSVLVNDRSIKTYNSKEGKTSDSENFDIPREIFPVHNASAVNLQPGTFYCLNDNIDNIHDSREWGPLTKKDITGKLWWKGF